MRKSVLAALLLFATIQNGTASSDAGAREIKAKSSIGQVTVFPAGAEIIRSTIVELEKGDHTVVIGGLPERLIDSSLRVVGEGDKGFEIGAVDSKRVFVNVDPAKGGLDKTERARLETELDALRDDSQRLSSRISAAQTQRRLMERLADLPGQPPVRPLPEAGGGQSAGVMSVESWGKIFDLIGARMTIADDQILKFKQQQRDKNKAIAKLKKRLSEQPPKKERQTIVRVSIASPGDVKGSLKLKYQVREASWRPFYDARLITGSADVKPGIELARRAGVRQWSGEDWTNIKLSLSTTSPQKGSQAPTLRPRRLDLYTPPVVGRSGGGVGQTMGMFSDAKEERAEAPMAAPVPMLKKRLRSAAKPAAERIARVRQYAFQAVFDIPGAVNVPSKGDEKKVAINTVNLKPALKIKTVPKLNPSAYLYAVFTHDAKATPLLPGRVALYRDGTFTGNGNLPLVNGGDEQSLGFGVDDAVKVERNEVKRKKGETGLLTTSKLDELRYVIKVTNLHNSSLDVEVLDQIPYSVNEKVIVNLLPATTKVSRKDVDKKRGILAWDFKLEGGKSKQINLDYSISWPAKRQLMR